MFNESKEFIKSKTRGSKGTDLAKALERKNKINHHKDMIKLAHKRTKKEGVDFDRV